MAKTAKKKSKPKTGKAAAKPQASHPEDHVDGCLCDVDVPDHMFTSDEDLPITRGGVARS